MVPKHITSILILIASSVPSLHAQTYDWSFSLGNPDYDYESRMAIDNHSNMYVAAPFSGTLDVDPGPDMSLLTSSGGGNYLSTYIAKYDSTGKFLWVKLLTGDEYQIGKDIIYDSTGFIYVFGNFNGTCDFDPGPNQYNLTSHIFRNDPFLLKLDLDGNFIWAINMGGNGQEEARRISLDADGNIIAGGTFSGTSDFDPGPNQSLFTVLGLADMFMVKYSANGDFIWARHTAGNIILTLSAIVTDKENNVYIDGTFNDYRNFNPQGDPLNIQATGLVDIYIMKMDPAGNLVWVRHLGNDAENWASDLALDHEGSIYVAGRFSGGLDFDPGPETDMHSAILNDIFILKLDRDGQFISTIPLGGFGYEEGTVITLDRNGGIYITGYYTKSVDFDPGPNSYILTSTGTNDKSDAFLLKLHPDGSFGWAHTLGGLEEDIGYGIEIGPVDEIYATGTFYGTAGFNPEIGQVDSLISNGLLDLFYLRWRQCLESYGDISVFSCGNYHTPSGNHIIDESGTYLDTIQNKAGCDSIITIHLVISDLGLTITQQGDTLIAGGGSKFYDWLDCDNGFAVVGTGPEFNPPFDGNYALSGAGFVCSDTSDCFAFVMTYTNTADIDQKIEIYPNPVKNELNIDLKNKYQNVNIAIYSVTGVKVYQQSLSDQQFIPVELRMDSGIYFISINTGQKVISQKFIVD